MTSATTRIYVRHVGDESIEVLTERDRKVAARRTELATRQAALRETDPELADSVERHMRKRRR